MGQAYGGLKGRRGEGGVNSEKLPEIFGHLGIVTCSPSRGEKRTLNLIAVYLRRALESSGILPRTRFIQD